MPNWCNNNITINGDYDTLVQLKSVVEAGEGLLQAIAPMPKELEGTTAPSDEPNWYDWCHENWGTKWDPELHLEFIDNGDGTATITGFFETAWAPPIAAFETLAGDWDSCYIELFYEEGGMCFVGCWDSEGGDDYFEYGDIGDDIDAIEEAMPAYLNEAFGVTEDMRMWQEDEEMA